MADASAAAVSVASLRVLPAEITALESAAQAASQAASRQSVRGSSLLLAGRLLSLLINFATQVMVVRYLTTRDYGAFAYALAAVAFFDSISSLGLKRGIARFAPIYHERGDWNRLFGTLALAFGTTLAISTLVIASLHVAPALFGRLLRDDALAIPLLLVLILLVPLEALDETLASLFATFAKPKAIFFRKHILAPCLKLASVAVLVGLRAPVAFLAWAQVLASFVGVLLYGWMLLRLFRREGLLVHFRARTLEVPFREVFGFTIPLLASDLVFTVMGTASTFCLGYFKDSTDVAHYRAIVPAATLNAFVMSSFQLLYVPQVARLFARGDFRGIDALYWRTAVWIAVLSFPIFALTFCMAKPLTVALYGDRYVASAVLLQLLSLASYSNAATGFNGLTLRVVGRLRYMMIVNVVSTALCVALCLLLVPHWGALGAALGTAIAMLLHNVLKQAGLGRVAGLRVFDKHAVSFYAILGGGAVLLVVLQLVALRTLWTAVPAAALVSLAVVWLARDRLQVQETFPELLRVPVLGALLRAPALGALLRSPRTRGAIMRRPRS